MTKTKSLYSQAIPYKKSSDGDNEFEFDPKRDIDVDDRTMRIQSIL